MALLLRAIRRPTERLRMGGRGGSATRRCRRAVRRPSGSCARDPRRSSPPQMSPALRRSPACCAGRSPRARPRPALRGATRGWRARPAVALAGRSSRWWRAPRFTASFRKARGGCATGGAVADQVGGHSTSGSRHAVRGNPKRTVSPTRRSTSNYMHTEPPSPSATPVETLLATAREVRLGGRTTTSLGRARGARATVGSCRGDPRGGEAAKQAR